MEEGDPRDFEPMNAPDQVAADFRASWSGLTRAERRRALRALGIHLAIDGLGVCPAEVVLCLNGPTLRADRTVRRSLDNCRDFFGDLACLSATSTSSTA